jgi:hypothetical protein
MANDSIRVNRLDFTSRHSRVLEKGDMIHGRGRIGNGATRDARARRRRTNLTPIRRITEDRWLSVGYDEESQHGSYRRRYAVTLEARHGVTDDHFDRQRRELCSHHVCTG